MGAALEEFPLGGISLFCSGLTVCPLTGAWNCLLKLKGVLLTGGPPREVLQNQRGLALEDFSNLSGKTERFLLSHSTSPLPGREPVPQKLQLD